MERLSSSSSATFDEDGCLAQIAGWNRNLAEELARRNDIGPMEDDHWTVIDFVKTYYQAHGEGPPIVKIGKSTGMTSKRICELFPCGVARGAYRLAGLPRPSGCI